MNRRTFLASLPCIAAVGEEKKNSTIFHGVVADQKAGLYAHSPATEDGHQWVEEILRACRNHWGEESIGKELTVTVHPDGYDVRFEKG